MAVKFLVLLASLLLVFNVITNNDKQMTVLNTNADKKERESNS
jgi:hypothetical protein